LTPKEGKESLQGREPSISISPLKGGKSRKNINFRQRSVRPSKKEGAKKTPHPRCPSQRGKANTFTPLVVPPPSPSPGREKKKGGEERAGNEVPWWQERGVGGNLLGGRIPKKTHQAHA